MAKYNILRDNDDFLKKKVEEEKPEIIDSSREEIDEVESSSLPEPETESAEKELESPGDDIFSDDIFTTMENERKPSAIEDQPADEEMTDQDDELSENVEESDLDQNKDEFQLEETNDVEITETAETEYPLSYEKPDRRSLLEDIDEKQEGINYKPIIIGIGIVAAAVIIFFLVSNIFFGEETDENESPKVETAEERMQREQSERKQSFLSTLNKTTGRKMGSVHLLAGLGSTNVKFSSILLYGNTLDFEVFARDRESLANFNLKIKNNPNIKKYSIESVHNRPGSEGGLFALYDIDLQELKTPAAVASSQVTSISPSTWASSTPNKAGLTINSQRQISSRNENLFKISRTEYDLRGSLKNCLVLINNLAVTNHNLSVHKLSLLPTDQRVMSTSSYMLKLVIDFYL